MEKFKKLYYDEERFVAYRRFVHDNPRGEVVFLGGLCSDMNGNKATALTAFCGGNSINLTLFDYFGHGNSCGKFRDYNISIWLDNCLRVINNLTHGKQIIIGSSMGGWLMLCVAMRIPDKVKALIGLAVAPDFTEDLINRDFTEQQVRMIEAGHDVEFFRDEYSYTITPDLIRDGKNHLLLESEHIKISCPVRLIHGVRDQIVDYGVSEKVLHKLTSSDVELILLKHAEHVLNDDRSLCVLYNQIEEVISV